MKTENTSIYYYSGDFSRMLLKKKKQIPALNFCAPSITAKSELGTQSLMLNSLRRCEYDGGFFDRVLI